MKPPNKPITDDLPRLRDIVRGILDQEVNLGNVDADTVLLGQMAISVSTLRSGGYIRSDRAEALRNAILYAVAIMTRNDGAAEADVRIAVDVCRIAEDYDQDSRFNHNLVPRKVWAARLQEVLEQAMLAKHGNKPEVMLPHLARWVTLCTLWVALILDEKEPE